jgi:hypothetical protein
MQLSRHLPSCLAVAKQNNSKELLIAKNDEQFNLLLVAALQLYNLLSREQLTNNIKNQ